jgi:hypothetical protein
VIKLRRIKWVGSIACMGKLRNAYKILVGKPEGKRLESILGTQGGKVWIGCKWLRRGTSDGLL